MRNSASLKLMAGFLCASVAGAQPAAAQTARVERANAAAARNDLTAVPQPRPKPVKLTVERPAAPPSLSRHGTGNPLWDIPLESLHVTRERPLFSVSRRPPPPPPAAFVEPAETAPPPPPAEPDDPPTTLIGVARSGTHEVVMFLDRSGAVIRLAAGQDYRGWVVRSVSVRAATFEKNDQQVSLDLPARNSPGASEVASIGASTPFVSGRSAFSPPVPRPPIYHRPRQYGGGG